MSFKLQDAIQKIKGMPGKYKRVLLAAASHARKDGSNIYASKETLGDGAGVSRWTAYRNIDPLIEMGILVEADSHTCANPRCPKGSKHSTGRGNHWTQAYNIDLVALQNATWEDKKSRSKIQESGVAKCSSGGVAKCDANKGVREARFTGSDEPSVLTNGSKKESKPVSLATTSLASPALHPASPESQNLSGCGDPTSEEQNQDQKQNQEQPQHQFPQSREEMYDAPMSDASELLHIITPNVTDAMVREQLPLCARILEFFPRADEYAVKAAELVLGFNRAHRSGKYATKDDKKLYIRNAAQYLKALESSTASLLNDYDNHDFKNCETCRESGVFDYKAFVREIRKDQEREAEQKKRDAANAIQQAKLKAERERKERLCPECQKTDRGEHIMSSIGGWVKVCNACYDKRYESEQEHIAKMGGWRNNLRKPLEPRPEYAAAKEAEARAAIAKAMDDAEEDVPVCPQCHRAGKNPKGFQKHWDNCPVFREGMMQALQPVAKAAAAPKGFDVEEA